MRWLHIVPLRLRSLFRRARVEHELDEELQFHLDRQIQENIARGMPPANARYAALRAMGGVEQRKEECRDARGIQLADTLLQDVRYALRQLRANPGFAAAAILTLALGIGANTAIFSLVDAVIFRPLTYPEAGRLVVVHETATKDGQYLRIPVNALHFSEWRRTARSFEYMALVGGFVANLNGSGEPERIMAARISPSLFTLLGVQPMLGRTFLDEEDRIGREQVVVLSHELWRRRFAADPNVLGKKIVLDGNSYEIVGVLPAGFHFPKIAHLYELPVDLERPEIWRPFAARPEELQPIGDFNYVCIGRLKPHVSMEQALSEIDTVQAQFKTQAAFFDIGAAVVPLQDQMIGRSRRGLELMLAAVGAVLLVGCVNIANLLLTRISARRREISIRAAIGASRARLIRQMLMESLVLSLIGGACGLVIAYNAIGFMVAAAPADVPRLDEVHLDFRVFLFAFAVSRVTGLLVGLLPALRCGRAVSLMSETGGMSPSSPVQPRSAHGRERIPSAGAFISVPRRDLWLRSLELPTTSARPVWIVASH